MGIPRGEAGRCDPDGASPAGWPPDTGCLRAIKWLFPVGSTAKQFSGLMNRTFNWYLHALPRIQCGFDPGNLPSVAISLPHVRLSGPSPVLQARI